ncbi:2093_t:CDS:2, partial [Gigaspora margarita]
MDIESLYSQVKFKSLRYCSKPVPVINYYNNDPVPEVINKNESESVQHGNLDDVDEQIDNRIIEIQQKINIVKDIIKGNYYNLGISYEDELEGLKCHHSEENLDDQNKSDPDDNRISKIQQ